MIISEECKKVHHTSIKTFILEKGKYFICSLSEDHPSKYSIFKGFKDKISFWISAGDDKHIERDIYKIQPPLETDDFKLLID